ncbi:MAG: four helix bundle protein [Verrucomicrobia bacterium]|nr:four helix bundle protein [Verrucomicrobiota bacterium]
MKNFRELTIWQRSHQLTLRVYATTRSFPKEELFGLTSQARRASSSVPTNIAEGCGRDGDAELKRFLQIAMGSATELEYHLQLAADLGYLSPTTHSALNAETVEVKKMLTAFIRKLRADQLTAAR